jgi:cystathionine gamma-lyase
MDTPVGGPQRRDATRVAHAGLPAGRTGDPFLPGPSFAAPFHLVGRPEDAPYGYGRDGNPTWTAYETALGSLEDAEALVLSSGMAAVSAVLLSTLRPGDVLVAPVDGYPGVRSLAGDHLAPLGIEVRLVATEEAAIRAALPGATLVWIETPSNPCLDVVPIPALAEAAHAAGAALAVDNTVATALGQRPLDLGADVSVTSASKSLTGHSDLVLGSIATRDAEWMARIRRWRTQTGSIPGPFETWLAHRSLATLDVRLERACANARALADALAARPDVQGVRYPGRPEDPSHAVAAAQMTRFGALVGFTLDGAAAAQAFLAASDLVLEATSFGGVHTSAERRARWGGDQVPEGFNRLSAGIEAPEDLLADVLGALDAIA